MKPPGWNGRISGALASAGKARWRGGTTANIAASQLNPAQPQLGWKTLKMPQPLQRATGIKSARCTCMHRHALARTAPHLFLLNQRTWLSFPQPLAPDFSAWGCGQGWLQLPLLAPPAGERRAHVEENADRRQICSFDSSRMRVKTSFPGSAIAPLTTRGAPIIKARELVSGAHFRHDLLRMLT